MRYKRDSKALLAAAVSALLMVAATMDADSRPAAGASISRVSAAPNAAGQTRRGLPFKTERTDSWLCSYVSPFFCTNLFPTLETRPGTPSPSTSIPPRGRK